MTSLVFDTTALGHFARAGRMDELRIAVADDEPVLLAEVAAELARGIPGHPSLGSATAGGWLKQAELEELPELAAFARYKGELGGGPPLVTGIGQTPGTPAEGGRYAAELTLLRIITGDLRLDTHEARMFACAAVKQSHPARLSRYTRYLRRLASPTVRRPLEDLMKTVWKDDFVDGLLDEGREDGRLSDAREKLLQLLGKRLSVSATARKRVEGCADIGTINTWLDRAITAKSLKEVFAE